MKRLALLALAAPFLWGQPPQPQAPALLSNTEAATLFARSLQLVESTMVAVPDLSRAGEPLLERGRQALANLRLDPASALDQDNLLTSIRAYLTLADAVPKPSPFPEEGRKQFEELRDSLNRMDANFRALIQAKDRQLRSPDPDNLARYAEIDSRTGPPAPSNPRVLFLGDSITDMWRLNEYFPGRDFINRGIGLQTSTQMLGRMEADVISLHPAALIVLAGTNDLARQTPLSTIEGNITAMADLADHFRIKVIAATLLPVSDYHKDVNPVYARTSTRPPDQIRALNSWIETLCTARGYTFLDYYSDMVDAAGFLKTDLSDDGLHPNSKGYRIMAPLALAAIQRTVAPTASPEKRQPKPKRHRLFNAP